MIRRILLFVFALSLAYASSPSHAQDQNIHALRGAYLFYFSHFIEWPVSTVFPLERFELCALTSDQEAHYQLMTLHGKSLQSSVLNINILSDEARVRQFDLSVCHLLYVSENFSEFAQVKLSQLPSTTILVTEGEREQRGTVHLMTVDSKLKFSIDHKVLKKRKFKVSSKLLRLSVPWGADV